MAQASKAKFLESGPFHRDLKAGVNRYFQESGKAQRDQPAMYLKSAIILSWFAASWAWLMFFAAGPVGVVLGCLSLGLATAGIGFSVQHDGGHGGYSERPRVNRVFAYSLDLVGGSSYVWNWKHNIFHHSHPNVVGLDADLNIEPFGRFAPEQRLRGYHRYQHLYLWFLYGVLAVKWHWVDDFADVIRGKVGAQKLPRPTGWKLVKFIAGKVFFFSWSVVLPLMLHPIGVVAIAYAATTFVLGLTLALTFQLAHCVDEAEFPTVPRTGDGFGKEWAVHQVQTTVDFAPRNRFVSWYLGGLNFQVVHHLFPKICHTHYPALAKVVEETCLKHGIRYRSQPTVWAALMSHVRWLKRMGRAEQMVEAAPPRQQLAA